MTPEIQIYGLRSVAAALATQAVDYGTTVVVELQVRNPVRLSEPHGIIYSGIKEWV